MLLDQTIRFLKPKSLRFVIHVPGIFNPVELIKTPMSVAVMDASQHCPRP
jgi:hypothetical protein